jgi:hypothetical protein
MRFHIALVAVLLTVGVGRAGDEYPKAILKSDELSLTVYLPDEKAGFYRGTRFDWSGVIGSVEYAGHKVFGPWKDTHNPANHDDIVGPVEEFGMQAPLGYAEAKEGESFLKIGVGELVKPKEEKYRFWNNYAIKHPGTWGVVKRFSDVEFQQALLSKSGYGYRYTKTVAVDENRFSIRHELANTGTKPIDTDQYNHNFFNVDDDTIGPNYTLTFPFTPTAPAPRDRFRELVDMRGRQLLFKGKLDKGSLSAELGGLSGEVTDYKVSFTHIPSAVILTAEGDVRVERINLWGTVKAICPEPFIRIKLKPGESKTWSVTYSFSRRRVK